MKKLSPGSETLYRYWQNRFQDWLNGRSAATETGEAFLSFLEASSLRPNTVGCAARALRRIGLDVPAPSMEWGEPKYLELDDVKRLIKTAPSLLEKTILTVTFGSACRISEVLNLELSDLELDNEVATVTRKGARRERVALGKQATEALREWLSHRRSKSKRVFMDYTYQDIYRMLKQTGKIAGIPDFAPHQLRHSRIRHLMNAGVPIEMVSEIAGHRRLDTTLKIYGRLRAEERGRYLVGF